MKNTNTTLRTHTYGLLVFISLAASGVAHASATLEATYTTGINNGWQKVERWRDSSGHIGNESFPVDGRGDQSGQRATFFASNQPSSTQFLLYHAPGWDRNSRQTPVLLIHGANQDADLAWANPNEAGSYGCGRQNCPSQGLMQALANDDYKVFALNLAHKNGDGFTWAEQIANAIAQVKNKTGATQVDLVTWSKSAFNARMYISSLTNAWSTKFNSDVRKLVMLGAPNNGIDWSFRHGVNHTYGAYSQCGGSINGPTAHDQILCFGLWYSSSKWVYDSPYFPGSAQMLKALDDKYALPTTEQDWYTTYYGGLGFVSKGRGIATFTVNSLVDQVRSAGTDSSVQVYNLCGDQADMAFIHNEHTGPSDGVVFISSCIDSTGISNLAGSAVVATNHLELGWEPSAINQIKNWLSAP
ncbi:lipase [Pseudoalteromonas sp. OF7H-1]|uniref:esterase/lipase family protein n=1 Tax=Pseudoalteromonas sp. OF7H-1 TaxID=2917755 RepID=UPI001EF41530|nr:lipase [Pseudoalteromonas sp. OF7H-1]MCG7541189.1 lipase [Pseudoalteromonas sp. OF7H-1]